MSQHRTASPAEPVGTFCLVLHSHLPWVLGHGRTPVGEEWLYRAWTGSYLPVTAMLRRLGREGRRDLLTLGVTPVLADQLDSSTALEGVHAWASDQWLRAQHDAVGSGRAEGVRAVASYDVRSATHALEELTGEWRHGGSAALRRLADDGLVELIGGPATHPFLPVLEPVVAQWMLQVGLEDALWRRGQHPAGLWSPECGHRDGLQDTYAATGFTHVVLDETTVSAAGRSVHRAWTMGATNVVAVALDRSVTELVKSSRTGYPTSAVYRDLHAVDPERPSGAAARRPGVPRLGVARGPWYRPLDAMAQTRQDADAFVVAVRERLVDVASREGEPGLVVAAFDTDLFGHRWHEGPAFLERVLRELPAAGVRVTTLDRAVHGDAGHAPLVRGAADLADGSWAGGDDRAPWARPEVTDLVELRQGVQRRLVEVVRRSRAWSLRRPELDQLVRQALLALASDWASMVTRDQAGDHARRRAQEHARAFHRLADLCDGSGETGRHDALAEAASQRELDGPFAWLDARGLQPT